METDTPRPEWWPSEGDGSERTATYAVQYCTAGLLLLLSAFLGLSWPLLLFLASAGVYFCNAYATQHSKATKVHYFDIEVPRPRRYAMLLLGVAQLARLAICPHLLFHRYERPLFPQLFFLLQLGMLVGYIVTILRRSVTVRRIVQFEVATAVIFAASLFVAHWTRGAKFAHHVYERRLIGACLTQLAYVFLLVRGWRHAPYWVLELANAGLWFVLWTCASHKHMVLGFHPRLTHELF